MLADASAQLSTVPGAEALTTLADGVARTDPTAVSGAGRAFVDVADRVSLSADSVTGAGEGVGAAWHGRGAEAFARYSWDFARAGRATGDAARGIAAEVERVSVVLAGLHEEVSVATSAALDAVAAARLQAAVVSGPVPAALVRQAVAAPTAQARAAVARAEDELLAATGRLRGIVEGLVAFSRLAEPGQVGVGPVRPARGAAPADAADVSVTAQCADSDPGDSDPGGGESGGGESGGDSGDESGSDGSDGSDGADGADGSSSSGAEPSTDDDTPGSQEGADDTSGSGSESSGTDPGSSGSSGDSAGSATVDDSAGSGPAASEASDSDQGQSSTTAFVREESGGGDAGQADSTDAMSPTTDEPASDTSGDGGRDGSDGGDGSAGQDSSGGQDGGGAQDRSDDQDSTENDGSGTTGDRSDDTDTRSDPPATSTAPPAPAPTGGGGPPGRVGDWVREATGVLAAQGVPTDQMNPDDIATIIDRESGGDPDAVNNSDSNAAKGTPSQGLMQTIGPTFDSYKLDGHGDIRDPVDNIIAGVRYAIARYGSVSEVPGVEALARGDGYVGY